MNTRAVTAAFAAVAILTVCGGNALPPVINEDGFDMVLVEGGTFLMGCRDEVDGDCGYDEKPAHSVTLNDFYIGRYEVTQGQWKAVADSNPSAFTGNDNLPVEMVSFNDIRAFIRKLNGKTGRKYRLPTEAEWEFAARGGNRSRGYKYSGTDNIDDVVWESGKTNIVGTKIPNELGIYDMSGNVYEWTNDRLSLYRPSSQKNPTGPGPSLLPYHNRVNRRLRGGSFGSNAKSCRVYDRYNAAPDERGRWLGFRLALDP